jgi:hypothetical protein
MAVWWGDSLSLLQQLIGQSKGVRPRPRRFFVRGRVEGDLPGVDVDGRSGSFRRGAGEVTFSKDLPMRVFVVVSRRILEKRIAEIMAILASCLQDGTGDARSKKGVAVFALAVRLFFGGNLVIKSQVELSRGLTLRLCITDLGNFEDGIKVGVLMGLYDALPIRSPIPGGLKSPLVASALGGVGILGSQVASPSHVSEEAVRLLLIQHAGVILPRESFPAGSAFCVQLRQWKAAKSAQGVALMTADDKSLVRIRRRVLKITVVSPAPQVLHDACIILQIRGAPHPGGLLLDDLELIMLLH